LDLLELREVQLDVEVQVDVEVDVVILVGKEVQLLLKCFKKDL
jgi:hypothetical protein